MKRLLATTAICLAPFAASAQDKSTNWSGLYIGAGLGAGWSEDHFTTTSVNTLSAPGNYANPHNFDRNGFRGALHAGYNHQLSTRWVTGVEADLAFLSGGKRSVYGIPGTMDAPYVPNLPDSTSSKVTWEGSLRARLGYLVSPSLMLFGTGGLGLAGVQHKVNCIVSGGINDGGWCDADASETHNRTRVGWTLGAGAEYRLTSNLTSRIEYRYADYGTARNTYLNATVTDTFSAKSHVQTQALMVGISYLFNTAGR